MTDLTDLPDAAYLVSYVDQVTDLLAMSNPDGPWLNDLRRASTLLSGLAKVLNATKEWANEDDEDLIRLAATLDYDRIDYDMEVEAYRTAQRHVARILAGDWPPKDGDQ